MLGLDMYLQLFSKITFLLNRNCDSVLLMNPLPAPKQIFNVHPLA